MKNRKTFFVIIGIVAIVLGVVCFILDVGSYERNTAYGGDAYTGIQNAAAQTANNVMCLAIIAKFGFGSILVVAGLSLIAFAYAIKTIDVNESATPFTPSDINIPVPEKEHSSVDSDKEQQVIDELKSNKKLLDDGIISQEEFDRRKSELLNK